MKLEIDSLGDFKITKNGKVLFDFQRYRMKFGDNFTFPEDWSEDQKANPVVDVAQYRHHLPTDSPVYISIKIKQVGDKIRMQYIKDIHFDLDDDPVTVKKRVIEASDLKEFQVMRDWMLKDDPDIGAWKDIK